MAERYTRGRPWCFYEVSLLNNRSESLYTKLFLYSNVVGSAGWRRRSSPPGPAASRLGYCSMWPRWADGRTVHPAACCSASPPMRARLALSPGPMRAAGSGLGSRVGLFNLRGGQQPAPRSAGWMDGWMDVCRPAMVTLTQLSPPLLLLLLHYQDVYTRSEGHG